ncbi:hypothetical protein L1987_03227 [Smallanthus sonchifolius]|uniref:Uncharacterized protein n=1 Tax=Smallanthus sonchifolius TaxID=185202 RepID=A0ACB9K9Y8_9ASTR|nr:hypothetical protein L1987_03227 [Smallanthus sonchifolius]
MGLFLSSPCRIKGNAAVAVIAMEHLLELEPEVAGNYVLLSNIYADLGRWDGVSGVRKLIQGKIMSKKAGFDTNAPDQDNFIYGEYDGHHTYNEKDDKRILLFRFADLTIQVHIAATFW